MSKDGKAWNQERDAEIHEPLDHQPKNPKEFIEALKKRFDFPVNVMSGAQLEARRQADLEMEAWHGKHPENKE